MNDRKTLSYILLFAELQNAGHKFSRPHCFMGKIRSDTLYIVHLSIEGFKNISDWLL